MSDLSNRYSNYYHYDFSLKIQKIRNTTIEVQEEGYRHSENKVLQKLKEP